MNNILLAVAIVGATGLLAGVLLAVVSHLCASGEDNAKQEEIRDALPGANCGACGFAGCDSYAEALDKGEAEPNLCAPGGVGTATKLSKILGIEVEATPKIAKVHCKGCYDNVSDKYTYEGAPSCKAAALLGGGPLSCDFGCIGFGDCVNACSFNALSIQNGLATVDARLCTGCGACKKACPKGLIEIYPKVKTATVVCSNHDKGAIARKVCKTACIGCSICKKNCPSDAITMENFLAVINPELCTGCGICSEKCPQKAISI